MLCVWCHTSRRTLIIFRNYDSSCILVSVYIYIYIYVCVCMFLFQRVVLSVRPEQQICSFKFLHEVV